MLVYHDVLFWFCFWHVVFIFLFHHLLAWTWRDHSGVRPGEIILDRGLEGSFSVDHFVVGLGGIILGGLILGWGLKGSLWELGGSILDGIIFESWRNDWG